MKKTLADLLIEAAQRFPDDVWVKTGGSGMTFAELSHGAGRLAASLRSLSLADQRIGVLLPNHKLFPLALHALLRCRGSALLLNPANSQREIAEQLTDAGVGVVLTIDPLKKLLEGDVTALTLDDFPHLVHQRRGGSTAEIPLLTDDSSSDEIRAPEEEAVVVFTAAMEGRARGAVLTHDNLVANLTSTVEAMALKREDRVLAALPFAHAFGFTVCLNAPLQVGASVLAVPRFNPITALELIASELPTVLAGVPAMFAGLLNAVEKRGTPEHALRVALCGGAPLPLELARRWEDRFEMPLRQGYGLTEAAPVCLFNQVDRPNRIGTLGEPLPGVEISIRDEDSAALSKGEVGELCIRGDNVSPGYLDGLGPSSDGWLHTGDLASIEGDAVRFRGTLKKMFTRNGFNVYPDEVRRALSDHEAIADAFVLARPDLLRENDIILTVVPADGVELSEDDVREICGARLAAYKQPSIIRIARRDESAGD